MNLKNAEILIAFADKQHQMMVHSPEGDICFVEKSGDKLYLWMFYPKFSDFVRIELAKAQNLTESDWLIQYASGESKNMVSATHVIIKPWEFPDKLHTSEPHNVVGARDISCSTSCLNFVVKT